MIRKPTPVDIFLLILVSLIWASAFLAIKVAVREIGPVWLVAVRVLIGFLAILPWIAWRGLVLPTGGRQWALTLFVTVLSIIAPFFLISWAELTIDSGVTSLLMGMGPFMAMILSHLTTEDDRMNVFKVLAVVCGFAGVLTVIGPSVAGGLGDHLLAQAAALGGSMCYAIAGVFVRRVRDIPPTRFSGLILGISALLLVPYALATGQPDWTGLSAEAIVALIYLGIFPTALGYILRYHLIRTIGQSYFTLGLNFIPIFGVSLGALVLDEPISLSLFVALALVVTGLFFGQRGARRSAPEKLATP
ncbi:drug/metabolite transporter (DMT)-like permease [Rhodobium orientis]|uniref:EamA family transporter n=1 Tax=Rhodobium orientis TaxID=34017 RepID=A0A327JFN0_9HYPH|nr:DMT family transporter [Rhodobium orientis]MBB4301548.1 drug/metabolite transporter (DMT)-like permease [Rhodobium orientis]MBK5952244.1 EamA family transporter [Rhodobium orientis]RAI24935.1 EamA family transporter [Rhodobium orientis]